MNLSTKTLFLIDGTGAVLSAFLLGFVLVRFEVFFGIPASTLYFLATLPVLFAMYDLYCYRKGKSGHFLKSIAAVNLLYCCLSAGFAMYHSDTLTAWGWLYILVEISIVIALAITEWRVAVSD